MTEPKYNLYHTLNKNLKGRLRSKDKELLMKKVSKFVDDKDLSVMILMLIIEHARVCGDISIELDSSLELPYGIRQRTKGTQIDIDKLPIELQEILFKFVKLKR